ncbi:MAG: PKD domain-containing protein, partial [Actinomycetota bacterium]|nr:PKD domain-containing protein [Actinomycetota bacterium]
INTWTTDTIVGGTGPGEANVLSGNAQTGAEISHGSGTQRNKVVGNYIGTDTTGNAAPAYAANGQTGVKLEGAATCSTCAPDIGYNQATDNVIVNNAIGGVYIDKGAHDSVVARNRIGLTRDGTPAKNKLFGVRIEHGAVHNTVGPGNEIAYNDTGIQLQSPGATPSDPTATRTWYNTITQNSVHDNAGLGIDIEPLGQVNPNDDGDVDSGANTQLNFPVLTSVTSTAVAGSACSGCTVELFIADAGAGAYGEGKTHLSSVAADGSGAFSIPTPSSAYGKIVTATATDGTGNTSEFSKNVAVPAPDPSANTPPTASFTSSCSDLTCSMDGTASTDGDGTIAAWSWDFGDGATAGGPTTSHTYSAAGTYTVVLTVTDEDGATGSTSSSVSVTAPPPSSGALVNDSYARSVSNGWGSADVGGPYLLITGAESSYAVAGGVGTMSLAAGTGRRAYLTGVSERDLEMTTRIGTDKSPAGGSYGQLASVAGRRVSANNEYRARVRLAPGSAVYLSVVKLQGTYTEVAVGSEVRIPELAYAAGTTLLLKAAMTGANPTTITVKAWASGQLEPTSPQLSVTDSEPALQAAGAVGLITYLSSAATNGPVLFSFDDFTAISRSADVQAASPPAAPTNLLATAVSRSQIDLLWDPSPGATKYALERSSGGTSSWAQVAETTTTSFSDTALATFTSYSYRVRALNDAGYSEYSNVATARTTKR